MSHESIAQACGEHCTEEYRTEDDDDTHSEGLLHIGDRRSDQQTQTVAVESEEPLANDEEDKVVPILR